MKVTLINTTPHALETLIFTKRTRLRMAPEGLQAILNWSDDRKATELEYMKNTIQSQFEFVDYIFCIEGVTRAFTHQLVRHRVGTSFAQQAQRVVDMEGFEYLATGSCADGPLGKIYNDTMAMINDTYSLLMHEGAKPQDARGVLPTNICTNIIFKANLRTLSEMAKKRLCVKTQGEFQDVFLAIVDRVLEVHPWAEPFLRVHCACHGTCLFHTLPTDQCHVKPIVYNPETQEAYGGGQPASLLTIKTLWASQRTEIQPVVKHD